MFQILLPAVPVVHQLITTNLMISNFQDKNTGSDRTKSNINSINNAINNNNINISDNINYTGSTTIRIINIYVQCNEKDKDKREKLLNELLKLMKEADQRKFHLVIMGDFNADMERYIAKIN